MKETEKTDKDEQPTANELALAAKYRRIGTILRVVLVIVGAIITLIAVSAVLDLIVIDAAGEFFLFALGLAMILTGWLKMDFIQMVT